MITWRGALPARQPAQLLPGEEMAPVDAHERVDGAEQQELRQYEIDTEVRLGLRGFPPQPLRVSLLDKQGQPVWQDGSVDVKASPTTLTA